jgi:hypothetical protein
MNFRISPCLLLLALFSCCGLAAQGNKGFDGFPSRDTLVSVETSPSAELMFGRFLTEQLHITLPTKKSVYILVPENGCAFCAKKAHHFYEKHHARYAALKLILSQQALPGTEVQYDYCDKGRSCGKYGFSGGFPVLAMVEDGKTTSIIKTTAETVEEKLEEALLFLGN